MSETGDKVRERVEIEDRVGEKVAERIETEERVGEKVETKEKVDERVKDVENGWLKPLILHEKFIERNMGI